MSKDLKVEIWATPNPAADEGYDFEMYFKGKKTKCLTFNKTDDGMNKAEDYRIDFILENKGHKKYDLRFSQYMPTVMWAKPVASPDDECPKKECHMPGVFFVDPDSELRHRKLKVINTDPSEQLFKFAFNFLRPGQVDGPKTDYACYDPIGSNQNGGSDFVGDDFSSGEVIGWTLVGVGVAALAFFAFRAWSK